MTDVASELLNMFKDRIRSRFWPTYIVVWCAYNWKFLYILIFAPFSTSSGFSSLNELSTIHETWKFFLIPLFVSIPLSMIIPYIDAGIGFIQHKALVWNKTQSTRLELVVEQKNTELKKLLSLEVKEQTLIEKETEEERRSSVKFNQQKSESLRIYNHLDKLVSENTLLAILDHHDSLRELSTEVATKLKQYIRAAQTIEYTYPNKDVAKLHENFALHLRSTEQIFNTRPRKLLSELPDGSNRISQEIKRTIESTISEYRKYRLALKDLYSF